MPFLDTKDGLIRARISQSEKRVLFEIACKQGMTLSEYIRKATTEAARRVAA
jgi:uncharacterized protein (DUF1778 family)